MIGQRSQVACQEAAGEPDGPVTDKAKPEPPRRRTIIGHRRNEVTPASDRPSTLPDH